MNIELLVFIGLPFLVGVTLGIVLGVLLTSSAAYRDGWEDRDHLEYMRRTDRERTGLGRVTR